MQTLDSYNLELEIPNIPQSPLRPLAPPDHLQYHLNHLNHQLHLLPHPLSFNLHPLIQPMAHILIHKPLYLNHLGHIEQRQKPLSLMTIIVITQITLGIQSLITYHIIILMM